MTTLKTRKITTTTVDVHKVVEDPDDMTVEQYLEKYFEDVVKDFKDHTAGLIFKLRQDYEEGAESINQHMLQATSSVSSADKQLCVVLKVTAGSHIGQKFRLEPTTKSNDDIFKMGRSTGRHFKEKGVSLYKDKEISTTHAKIELRNNQVFLIDCNSTNGTQLNGEDIAPEAPLRLKQGDKICMGSTELTVNIDSDNVNPTTGEQETY